MATSRVLNTTIDSYVKGREELIMRKRRLTALFKEKGRITYGHSGLQKTWRMHYKRAPLIAPGGGNFVIDFPAHNTYKTASVPWKVYVSSESINKMEKLMNSGPEAQVKLMSTLVDDRLKDIQDNFAPKLYVDGSASGYTNDIWGLNTMFGYSAASTKQPIGLPQDNYAGVLTDLGSAGGTWSTDGGLSTWPLGDGDAHYDFNSPLIVDITSTQWQAATKTWPNTCLEAIPYAVVNTARNGAELDVIMLEKNMWLALRMAVDARDNIYTERSAKNSLLVNLGFKNVINIDGVDCTWEIGPPIENGYGTGYGLCMDELELMSMQKQLFVTAKDFQLGSFNDIFAIDYYGNMRCTALRNQCKFRKIS